MQSKLYHFTLVCWALLASIVLMLEGCAKVSSSKAVYPTPFSTSASYTRRNAGQHPYSSTVQIKTANRTAQTVQVKYLLYLPDTYGKSPRRKWPLILFLHGMGERGDNLELLKKHPLPKTLTQQIDFPFIVVSPQLSAEKWSWSEMIDPLNSLLDQIQVTYYVDPQRIYLTGISMGGSGAWEFALRYPKRFAALVPIAGYYQYRSHEIPPNICVLRDVPIWVFHGDSDTEIQSFQSEVLVEALKACGGNIRFTLYPDADHAGTWIRAYADPELYKWLLEQQLGGTNDAETAHGSLKVTAH